MGRGVAVAESGVVAGSDVGGGVGVPVGTEVPALQDNNSAAMLSIPKCLALDKTLMPPNLNPKP